MRGLDADNKWLAFPMAIFFMGFVMGFNLIIRPDLKKLADLKAEKKSAAAKAVVQGRIDTLNVNIATFDPKFMKVMDDSVLLERVSSMAKESGIKIVSMVPRSVTDVAFYRRMPLQIECEGSFHTLGNFVSRLESTNEFMKVTQIEIKPVRVNGEIKSLNFDMIVSVFFKGE